MIRKEKLLSGKTADLRGADMFSIRLDNVSREEVCRLLEDINSKIVDFASAVIDECIPHLLPNKQNAEEETTL